MNIPFAAYAEDCTLTGDVAFESDRLSDFLAATTEFELDKPAFRALDDGREVHADTAAVLRDDLCVVVATGPRGRVERRIWTRQYPVRVRIGPYTVLGYLHAPATIDPFKTAYRRPIVALTACIIEYAAAGEIVRIESDAMLVNTSKIERLEAASELDLRLNPDVEIPRTIDARSKDMTQSD
jgi:hypothetical protein